jgi:hypothetical protein
MKKQITDEISLIITPLEESKTVHISISSWGRTTEEGFRCLVEHQLTVNVETASWIEGAINTSLQEISRYKEDKL